MQSEKFIELLIEQTKQIIDEVETLKNYDLHTLTWKKDKLSWSILECIEHLNLYGDFYLPQMESKIKNSATKNDIEFKSGFLGNYFAKSMLPKEKINRMKTFKNKNPLNATLDKVVIDKFINQQTKLLSLLNEARNVSLNKVKIQTSISSLITLKLGDTLQFFTNHVIRHLTQIDRIRATIKNA